MESVKEKLHKTIDALSEEQAKKILDYAENIDENNHREKTLKRLAKHPAIKVPDKKNWSFSKFDPIPTKGIQGSELLIKDRK